MEDLSPEVREWLISDDTIGPDEEGLIFDDTQRRYITADEVVDAFKYSHRLRIERFIEQIKNWDTEYIEELQGRLNDFDKEVPAAFLRGAIDADEQDHYLKDSIDYSALPSAPIPDDIHTNYPIWACDHSGRCLVGEDMQMINTLAEIREVQAERKRK